MLNRKGRCEGTKLAWMDKRKKFRSHKSSSSQEVVSARPQHFKSWSEEAMKLAYKAVIETGESVRKAAMDYGVPHSTLHDRVSGKIALGAVSGPPRYLTNAEEGELVKFLNRCSCLGFARTKRQVIALVQAMVAAKQGKDAHELSITKGWWVSFNKRHPQLTVRAPEKLAYARAIAVNKEVIDHYYDLLEATLSQNHILNKPMQIFNCDESGFPLEHKPEKVIGLKGMRQINTHTSGEKAQITVLACASASGYVMPPMVIYDRKNLKQELHAGEVPGTIYGLSEKGWIDTELFELWLDHHFLHYAPPARPLLLLLDGHSSHYQPTVVRKAAANDIILFCLPPHTTHLAQPLDRSIFSPLKTYWNQECQNYLAKNPGKVISRNSFSQIFSKAWFRGMTPENITAGFRATGVFPLNRNAIHIPGQESECDTPIRAGKSITYLPLYSPAPPPKYSALASLSTDAEDDSSETFSPGELKKFKRRFEEGFNVTGDERYNKWLKIHHPVSVSNSLSPPEFDLSSSDHESLEKSPQQSSDEGTCLDDSPELSGAVKQLTSQELSVFLKVPTPLSKKVAPRKKARVLTSLENLQLLEQKEKEKQELIVQKEHRKREREEKRKQKELKKQQKVLERQQKAQQREEAKRQKESAKQQRQAAKQRRQAAQRPKAQPRKKTKQRAQRAASDSSISDTESDDGSWSEIDEIREPRQQISRSRQCTQKRSTSEGSRTQEPKQRNSGGSVETGCRTGAEQPSSDEGDSEPVVDKRPVRSRRQTKSARVHGEKLTLAVKSHMKQSRGSVEATCSTGVERQKSDEEDSEPAHVGEKRPLKSQPPAKRFRATMQKQTVTMRGRSRHAKQRNSNLEDSEPIDKTLHIVRRRQPIGKNGHPVRQQQPTDRGSVEATYSTGVEQQKSDEEDSEPAHVGEKRPLKSQPPAKKRCQQPVKETLHPRRCQQPTKSSVETGCRTGAERPSSDEGDSEHVVKKRPVRSRRKTKKFRGYVQEESVPVV